MTSSEQAPAPVGEANVDLAGCAHWASIYRASSDDLGPWSPVRYHDRLVASLLVEQALRVEASSLLEVGCGNSVFLPFVAKAIAAKVVAGMDYEPGGCDQARRRLVAAGVTGTVVCRDLFSADAATVGQYDMVFSLGLVEHFTDTAGVVRALARLVRPGGLLVSVIPNLFSMHGLLSWIWHPSLLEKHLVLRRGCLRRACCQAELEEVDVSFAGVFSLRIVAWERDHRWPRLQRALLPWVRRALVRLDRWWLDDEHRRSGWAPFAPYLVAIGRRPGPEGAA